MNLSDAELKKIIARRDPLYDGRFFFGVKTTGIYCRPICPAKSLAKNRVVFRSATEAELSGYRPCRRCHPEAAPASRILQGTANTVSRALQMMNADSTKLTSLPALADSLGITDRHLRRLFDQHLGAPPIAILNSRRLHFARQLISETSKPITEIALASGFQSVRRFNEAFKLIYQKNPTAFRKERGRTEGADEKHAALRLSIAVKQPYDWPMVLKYLKRHECHGVELVNEFEYVRFLPEGQKFSTITVTYDKKKSTLLVDFQNKDLARLKNVLNQIKYLFDTDHDPSFLDVVTGIRVPRSFSAFEIAISILFNQLVSTAQAKATLKKFVIRYGKKLGTFHERDVYRFPTPGDLRNANFENLGLTQTKIHAIRELSRQIHTGEIQLSPTADLVSARAKLRAIKGVGPWTVEMIAMRCLGDADAFPAKDLIVNRAAERNLFKLEKWLSQRAYLTHYIWSHFAENLQLRKMKK